MELWILLELVALVAWQTYWYELKPKIGNKTGNKFETELQKEIVVCTYLVMLVLCNRIRNSLELADSMLCYT